MLSFLFGQQQYFDSFAWGDEHNEQYTMDEKHKNGLTWRNDKHYSEQKKLHPNVFTYFFRIFAYDFKIQFYFLFSKQSLRRTLQTLFCHKNLI